MHGMRDHGLVGERGWLTAYLHEELLSAQQTNRDGSYGSRQEEEEEASMFAERWNGIG